MTVSVVIPLLDSASTIGEQLEAISQQKCTDWWEVVVVDNGSTDSSVNLVRTYQGKVPHLRVVDASGRRGASHARNIGVQAARGDALVFCDADDVVAPGWLAAMAKALTVHEFVACRYDFERLNPPWIAKGRGNSQANGPRHITFLPFLCAGGGGIGIRRSAHESVGGFDEDVMFLEDIDYCQRIQQKGVLLREVSEALVYCRHPSTYRGIYAQAKNWAQYEQLLFKRYQGARINELWRWRAFFEDNLSYARMIPKLMWTQERRVLCAWRVGRQVGCLKG
ncbi:MAG: glycosyltransferase family 2 protein, partial [Nitrospiraceae bacterium]